MPSNRQLVVAGLSLGLVSTAAFPHNDVGIGFSIAIPGAAAYVGSTSTRQRSAPFLAVRRTHADDAESKCSFPVR